MMRENTYELNTPITSIQEIVVSGISTHTVNVLSANGILTFADIMSCNPAELLKVSNFGKKTFNLILELQTEYRELYKRLIEGQEECFIGKEYPLEEVRFNLAKDILLVLIDKDFGSSENIQSVIKEAGDMYEFHSTLAVKYADALINKLKKDKTEE